MNKIERQNQIMEALKKIESDEETFACTALGYSDALSEDFSKLFRDPLQGCNWTFFSRSDGTNEDHYPPPEQRKNVRLTALWFFYHMQ